MTATARASSQAEAGGPCRYIAARPGPDDIAGLVAGGDAVAVHRGDHVFSEGDFLDAVYVIRRGKVALRRSVKGRDMTLLLLRDGDILGDIPLLLRAQAGFDAVAETDTELVRISPGRLLATLDRSPEFARRWVLWLSGRLSATQLRLLSLLAGDVRAQVAAVLFQEACRGDTVHLTHQELAEMVGAQRSSVTRALDDLATAGAVALGYGQVQVLDMDAVTRAAGGGDLDRATV